MTSVRWQDLARAQDGVFACWQLVERGWSPTRAWRAGRDQRRLYDGVYLTGFVEPTQQQWWRAATLTTSRTVLTHEHAAWFWDLSDREWGPVTVTRPGTTGPQRLNGLTVRYSSALAGNICQRRGMWITTPQRTILDVSNGMHDQRRRKLLREALRRQRISVASMTACLDAHPGRRGSAPVRALVVRYARLGLERCKSDAEAYAMEVLDGARRPLPGVNQRVAGEEADLSWPACQLIIEIDGPQFHRDKLEDARKTRTWVQAGWRVVRISSDDLFAHPEWLLELAPPR